MNQNKTRTTTRWTVSETARMALITGLYVVITVFLSVISFGAIQIRLSEMFNYLSLYNKRYIIAVTLGVAIANMASPLGIIDVVVGSVSTFIVLVVNYYVTRNLKNMKHKMIVTAILFAFSMFTVAGQLTILYDAPFFLNWVVIGAGELASMTVGGIIIHWASKKIDFTK
ncbi:hypothetical protein BAU15_08200 [Enterococcus sp. JM4C]|uniref:QueT transporter family protein n=1 Tax=Candidatus Enterococcus huntleyi TaxID=1857217 RepID=UPI00137AA706|nr:QueT transporter family protein [Enterococcus sp. JM4C]KAF1297876.1 hypothetical protein BAU15_08200 [Enterococcus sp. JM4C]